MARDVQVESVGNASYRVRYALPERPPTVSIIVPSTGKPHVLRPCIESLLERTSYPDLELIVVANQTGNREPESTSYLDSVAARPQARVLLYDAPTYNFSKTNNWAVEQARGELICFLNDDTEVIGSGWLAAMVSQILQDRVAAVGAKLLYPNGRIQHAGIVLGAGGVAAHTYRGSRNGIYGYHDRALVDQDVASVSAACMLVRRGAFEEVGGFDPALAVSYNDVDLCLRLRESGWRIVWTPSAELYHKEAASFGAHYVGETASQWEFELDLIRSRWADDLSSDPHYSPNLALDALQLWQPAFPPRVSYPWRISSQ
jgi:GT2 family glycosyltransferase